MDIYILASYLVRNQICSKAEISNVTTLWKKKENMSNPSSIKQIPVMKPGVSVGEEMKYAVLWPAGSKGYCREILLLAFRRLLLGHCVVLSRVDKYKNCPFFPRWQMYVVNRLENSCHFFISNQKQFFSSWIQSNFVATFNLTGLVDSFNDFASVLARLKKNYINCSDSRGIYLIKSQNQHHAHSSWQLLGNRNHLSLSSTARSLSDNYNPFKCQMSAWNALFETADFLPFEAPRMDVVNYLATRNLITIFITNFIIKRCYV